MNASGSRFGQMSAEEVYRAAGQNDPEALTYLGDALSREDPAKAAEFLNRAAELNYAPAIHKLGTACLQGGVMDPEKAFGYFSRASELGYAPSKYLLGTMYESGVGCRQDKDRANRLYREAAESGFSICMILVGRKYEHGELGENKPLAFEWYKRAEAAGDPEGVYHVGRCMFFGIGTQTDYGTGLAKIREAAPYSGEAANMAGIIYRMGIRDIIPANKELAADYMRQAAEKGEKEAMFMLAEMYIKDEVADTPDMANATKYLRMGAEKGDQRCIMILASVLRLRKDEDSLRESAALYAKAADMDVEQAFYYNGLNLFEGKYAERDRGKALVQFMRSLHCGVEPEACLERIGWYLSMENQGGAGDISQADAAGLIEEITAHFPGDQYAGRIYGLLSAYYFRSPKPDDLRKAADFQRMSKGKAPSAAPRPGAGSGQAQKNSGGLLGKLKGIFGK